MSKLQFGLVGDGYAAQFHHRAVEHVNAEIIKIMDPHFGFSNIPEPQCFSRLSEDFFKGLDYVIISSPTYFHYSQTKIALQAGCKVIVEKPVCLPWEPLIDDNRVNVVLQLRYLSLPERASFIKVVMVRNKSYFRTWKGDSKKTGGLFYNLFMHYIDLAVLLNADFSGKVISSGKQERWIDDFDILSVNTQDLYNKMYEDILSDRGRKPKDLLRLHWFLNHILKTAGDCLDKEIFISGKIDVA